eukprot:TRINITY_DN17141_c0_g1_i1.p1 TRINITY_DN17141_c0_g1~~TRINITY_DN17141_c0_g1_i1.p1  ORF type:complete len:601 (+),score=71.30 TRINITY_DN17141_c0_g1_i1:73-1875(+)
MSLAASALACSLLAALCVRSLAFSDLFRCPPTGGYKSHAYRVPISGSFLPVLSSAKPKSPKPNIAIIPIVGGRQEQEEFFSAVLKVAKKREKTKGSTVVVAPAFPRDACYANQWPPNKEVGKIPAPTWTTGQGVMPFYTGNDGSEADPVRISSFKALDAIVLWTVDNYPSLQYMVITGFSAGSQMALNYAILSSVGSDGVVTLGGSKVSMRFIVQSPGSVTFLSAERPAEECRPLENTGQFHTCRQFDKMPSDTCSGHYNDYQFGIDGFQDHGRSARKYPSVLAYMKENLDVGWGSWDSSYMQAIINRFETKSVRYQVGNRDTKSCLAGTCEKGCAQMLTGTCRLQRMQNFVAQLNVLYPNRPQANSLLFGMFDGGHNNVLGFESAFFALWTFEEPFAPPPPAKLPDTWQTYDDLNCFDRHGGKRILVDQFAITTQTLDDCKNHCEQQLQPLCEGVVTKPTSDGLLQCWLVSDVNIAKCKKQRGFTFNYLTYASAKGSELFGMGAPAMPDDILPSKKQMRRRGNRESSAAPARPSMPASTAAALLIFMVVACGVAAAALPGARSRRRKRKEAVAVAASDSASDSRSKRQGDEQMHLLAAE